MDVGMKRRFVLIAMPNSRHYPNPGRWGNFGETEGGVGKSGLLEHKRGNISETRNVRGKVTMEGL